MGLFNRHKLFKYCTLRKFNEILKRDNSRVQVSKTHFKGLDGHETMKISGKVKGTVQTCTLETYGQRSSSNSPTAFWYDVHQKSFTFRYRRREINYLLSTTYSVSLCPNNSQCCARTDQQSAITQWGHLKENKWKRNEHEVVHFNIYEPNFEPVLMSVSFTFVSVYQLRWCCLLCLCRS